MVHNWKTRKEYVGVGDNVYLGEFYRLLYWDVLMIISNNISLQLEIN